METISVTIPNMKSPHCQMAVTDAVKSVGGTIKSIAATKAEIELGDGTTKAAVIQAIDKAGYKVSNT